MEITTTAFGIVITLSFLLGVTMGAGGFIYYTYTLVEMVKKVNNEVKQNG